MIDPPVFPIIGLSVSSAAVAVWVIVVVRSIQAYHRGVEHRREFVIMAFSALIIAIGTLASAIGFAAARGLLPMVLDPDLVSMIASMGRGALLMAGLIVATHYRPPERKR